MPPERTCVGCRQVAPQPELVRLALDPSGLVVVVDPDRRTPGRGAYLHRDPACLSRAIQRRAVQRALRAPGADVSALSALETARSETALPETTPSETAPVRDAFVRKGGGGVA